MADYVPARDDAFSTWLSNFVSFCSTKGTTVGLTAEQVSEIQGKLGGWNSAFTAHVTATSAAKGATQTKDLDREEAEELARQLAMIMQNNPDMTDADRAEAGLTVRGQNPGIPESIIDETDPPILLLDWSQRGRMLVKYGTNPENGRRNPLPEGISAVRLWYALGGVPTEETGWVFLADDRRSPFVHVLGNMQPVTVAYRAQYLDKRLDAGAFCDPVLATVTP